MPLSPDQIASLRTSAGLSPTPPPSNAPASTDIIAQRKAALGMGTTPAPEVSQADGPPVLPPNIPIIKANPDATFNDTSGVKDIIKTPVKSAINLATFPARVINTVADTGKQAVGLTADEIQRHGPLGLFTAPAMANQSLLETVSGIENSTLKGLLTVTNPILGALMHGIKSVTGLNVTDKSTEADFQKAKDALVNHPNDVAYAAANFIHKTVTENPENYLLAADQLNTEISNMTGKPVDVVHSTANPIIDATKNAVEPVKTAVVDAGNAIKDATTKIVDKTPADQFKTNLDNAEQSIYGKMTPTEKASIKLRDENGVFGTKSVPDFQADPRTKPVIEAVANLPEDLQIKPSDSLAARESKIDQGISRLHQGTEGSLADPAVKESTKFQENDYDTFMKDTVLKPIEKEFGAASDEYTVAQKAIEASKRSLTSNDAEGVYKGRQKFNSDFEKDNPRTFKKSKASFGAELDPHTTAVVETGREIYRAMNDFTENLLPENHPLRPRMQEESNLIRAKEEMRARNSSDIGKSSTKRFLDRNPVAKKAVQTTAGVLKIGAGVDLIK